MWVVLFTRVSKEGLAEKVTVESRSKGDEGAKSAPDKAKGRCKGPEARAGTSRTVST